jgi:hypothetical protein
MHPELNHREISQMLLRAEIAGGLDIAMALTGELGKPSATSPGKLG